MSRNYSPKRTLFLLFAVAALLQLTLTITKDLEASAKPTKQIAKTGKALIVNPANYKPQTANQISAEGKEIFSQMNCASCHTSGLEGGCLGPPLAGVGAFRSKSFLEARLTNTKEAEAKFQSEYSYHAELMPHPLFAPTTAQKLIAYLLTLPLPKGGYQISKHAIVSKDSSHTVSKEASAADIAQGARSFYKFGCTACHSIGNVGGSLAPALDGIGSLRDLDYITDHITDAQFHTRMISSEHEQKPSKMPHFKATEKEIDQIASFLYTLKAKK